MKIGVANFPINCSQTDLEKLFLPCGKIKRVHLERDKEFKRKYWRDVWVEMPDEGQARLAIRRLDGELLKDATTRLEVFIVKEKVK